MDEKDEKEEMYNESENEHKTNDGNINKELKYVMSEYSDVESIYTREIGKLPSIAKKQPNFKAFKGVNHTTNQHFLFFFNFGFI